MSENYMRGLLAQQPQNQLQQFSGGMLSPVTANPNTSNGFRMGLSPAVRTPYQSELNYFKSNPAVTGMAAEDDNIILNPYSTISEAEKQAVVRNELARILMRKSGVNPSFNLTPQQTKMFQGTAYQTNPQHAKQSILARALSGDPSAGELTAEQSGYANFLRELWGWK